MLQGFANGGCYDEIDRRLGYRFRLVSGPYSATLMRGDTLQLELQVANDGFATMFNRRPVFAVLYKGAEQYACQLAADPRTWKPNTVTTISQRCGLSSTMSSGTYTLALWLPDQSSSIRDNPLYAVRLANQGLWDATRGYNVITDQVTIAP